MILGVTDRRPRRIVGSQAFSDLERTKAGLIERLRLRVDVTMIQHPDGRVIVFRVPSLPLGMPIQYHDGYWMRGDEDLIPMTADLLKRIFDEAGPDFSAEICPRATLADLDPTAIGHFRAMWQRKSGNKTEVIFEYRSSDVTAPAAQREEYRRGFFLFQDDIWQKINLRNNKQHFQYGFVMLDVPTFNEAAVREAILNAVSHRDYRLPGSIFVHQYPRRLEIVSPG